jgi:hypothetical protein
MSQTANLVKFVLLLNATNAKPLLNAPRTTLILGRVSGNSLTAVLESLT